MKAIDFESKLPANYYYDSNTPFFRDLEESITHEGTIYQWRRHYVRANKSGVSPTLTANMGMGGHNVPLVKTRFGIRKLTPAECFRLMGFRDFKLPERMADSALYKQAGNAVVVDVIEALAKNVRSALENSIR
jgi:DNA (cytosine-5)-methyltransferase 1